MVLGLLTSIVACPAIVGTTEAVRYGQKQNNREAHRARKHHLTVTLPKPSIYSPTFNNAPIVLDHGKFWIDTRKDARDEEGEERFPAIVNFLQFPGMKEVWKRGGYTPGGEGLVTMINEERHLNWCFVDKKSGEVRYGVKKECDEGTGMIVGPWDCSKIERRLMFQGWEGFIAVQENDEDELWALYFDCEDDGLRGDGQIGSRRKRMLEVEVWRKEIRRGWEDAMNERRERLEARREDEEKEEVD